MRPAGDLVTVSTRRTEALQKMSFLSLPTQFTWNLITGLHSDYKCLMSVRF